MRLAGQPFPHGASGWLESNQRSPVPETGGMSVFPTASRSTPGGTRTRASGLRTRRHCRSTTGAWIGGPGVEPGLARYQRAVPPRTPTSESSGGRSRTCVSRSTVARLAVRPHRIEQARAEGEGAEPPTAEAAPVFETGYRARGSPSDSGPGRTRTCTVPSKSRRLSRIELRSRGCGRQESNLRRVAFQATALPH